MDKIRYLDGLRGLAAFVVVLSHFVVVFYPALYTANPEEVRFVSQLDLIIAGTPLNILYNGNFAVCIFFILSGYVLTYKFFRDKNPEALASGAFRRYFRLLFPVLFSNLFVFVLMKLSLFHTGMDVENTMYKLLQFDFINNNPMFFHILGSVCIMLAIINSGKLQKLFSTKPLAFLGRISFPMYLVHLSIIGTFSCFLFLTLLKHMNYNTSFIISFFLSIALILFLSVLVNRYIDEKGIMLTHTFYTYLKNGLQKLRKSAAPPI